MQVTGNDHNWRVEHDFDCKNKIQARLNEALFG